MISRSLDTRHYRSLELRLVRARSANAVETTDNTLVTRNIYDIIHIFEIRRYFECAI